WKVRPDLVGTTDTWEPIPETIVSGTGWEITKVVVRNYRHWERVQKAIVDGIEYPLDLNKVIEASKNDDVVSFAKTLQRTELVLVFKTGEIELTPSRETLQYDRRTISIL